MFNILSIILCITICITSIPPEALALRQMSYKNFVGSGVPAQKVSTRRDINRRTPRTILFSIDLGSIYAIYNEASAERIPEAVVETTTKDSTSAFLGLNPWPIIIGFGVAALFGIVRLLLRAYLRRRNQRMKQLVVELLERLGRDEEAAKLSREAEKATQISPTGATTRREFIKTLIAGVTAGSVYSLSLGSRVPLGIPHDDPEWSATKRLVFPGSKDLTKYDELVIMVGEHTGKMNMRVLLFDTAGHHSEGNVTLGGYKLGKTFMLDVFKGVDLAHITEICFCYDEFTGYQPYVRINPPGKRKLEIEDVYVRKHNFFGILVRKILTLPLIIRAIVVLVLVRLIQRMIRQSRIKQKQEEAREKELRPEQEQSDVFPNGDEIGETLRDASMHQTEEDTETVSPELPGAESVDLGLHSAAMDLGA